MPRRVHTDCPFLRYLDARTKRPAMVVGMWVLQQQWLVVVPIGKEREVKKVFRCSFLNEQVGDEKHCSNHHAPPSSFARRFELLGVRLIMPTSVRTHHLALALAPPLPPRGLLCRRQSINHSLPILYHFTTLLGRW